MKNKIRAVVLSFLLISLSQLSQAGDGACQALFVTGRDQILEKVRGSEFLLLRDYQGQRGYLRFAEELSAPINMKYVFAIISQYLNKKEFKELGWQAFYGSTSDYRKLKEKILDKDGLIRTKYLGMEGYALFSDKHYNGNMLKAYQNISAILDKKEFKELGWQAFHRTTSNYRKLKEKIVDEDEQIRTEYLGMEGYAVFADRHYAGNMLKAYMNISSILGGVKKTRELGLGWKIFPGNASQFYTLKDLFDRYDVKQLKGRRGQAKVARKIFKGDRRRAYDSVSILREELLGNREAFNELKWMRTGKRKTEH